MDEFIVWDNNNKVFIDNRDFYISQNGELFTEYGRGNLVNINTFKYFRNIGLKDINGKRIYADSSIVEFDYKYLSGLVEKCIGCFIYDKEDLLYTIKLIGTPSKNCIDYLKSSMKNFKIIDTIQENKLRLIKA